MQDAIAFQGGSIYKVNGFKVSMTVDPAINQIKVKTVVRSSGQEIDSETFNYLEPSDVAAAFAKYSMSVSHAVTSNLNEQVI